MIELPVLSDYNYWILWAKRYWFVSWAVVLVACSSIEGSICSIKLITTKHYSWCSWRTSTFANSDAKPWIQFHHSALWLHLQPQSHQLLRSLSNRRLRRRSERCVLLLADHSASLDPSSSQLSPFMLKALSVRTFVSILGRCADVVHQHDFDSGNLPCFHLMPRLN